ncbi:MAG: SLATT domain-containing protein [Bryobacteraceae bacterium]
MNQLTARLFRAYNIRPPEWTPPSWQPDRVLSSLETLRLYAEGHARAAIDWYYAKKPWKAWASQALRFLTIMSTAVGGLMPILVSTGVFSNAASQHKELDDLRLNQIGYLCFGLAALFLAFDRYFGNSTGWMRYITTAMSLETALQQFRLDWARLTVSLGAEVPAGPVLEALIERIAEFSITVRTLVEKETQAWVTEFQMNLTQLEKEAKAAVEAARAQAETAQKDATDRLAAAKPGAIDLIIENVLQTDAGYDAAIDGEIVKRKVTSRNCGLVGLDPGLREVAVTAMLSGTPAHASQIVAVPAGAAVKVALTLTGSKSS